MGINFIAGRRNIIASAGRNISEYGNNRLFLCIAHIHYGIVYLLHCAYSSAGGIDVKKQSFHVFLFAKFAYARRNRAASGLFPVKQSIYLNNLDIRADILIGNKLVFDSGDVDKSDVQYNIDYTSDVFLSYYAFSEENPSNVKYAQFGHKAENQVLHNYFIDILHDEEKFISLFDKYNEKNGLFVRDQLTFSLKPEVVEQVVPSFIKNESVSSVGKTYISQIKNDVFLPMFSEIMDSIGKNDLTYGAFSYKSTQSAILGFESYVRTLITYASIVTVFISTALLHVLVPFLNKSRKTLGMMIMRIERVNIRSFNHLRPGETILSFVYQLFVVFLISFFIPMTTISFAEMFRIQLLFFMGIFTIFMMIINLIHLLFDGYNRTLFDRLLSCVYMSNGELDDIYRAKGYAL